jgi:hypothetical protein
MYIGNSNPFSNISNLMQNTPEDPSERLKRIQESFYKTLTSFFSGGTYNNILLGLMEALNENVKKTNTYLGDLDATIKKADESSTKLSRAVKWISVAGVLIAAFSFLATSYDAQTNKYAVISQRPYIDLITPRIDNFTENSFRFTSEIENVGSRPARNTNIEFYPIASIDGEKAPYGFNVGWCDEVTQLSNLVFPHKKLPEIYASGPPQYNDPTGLKYALVRVSYEDSILGDEYAQVFYYEWKVNSQLIQLIDRRAKNILDEYLEETAKLCISEIGADNPLSGFWSKISELSD